MQKKKKKKKSPSTRARAKKPNKKSMKRERGCGGLWGVGGKESVGGAAGYRKGTQFMLCGVLATERKSGKVGIGLHASDCPHADTLRHGRPHYPFALSLSLSPPLSPPPPPPLSLSGRARHEQSIPSVTVSLFARV